MSTLDFGSVATGWTQGLQPTHWGGSVDKTLSLPRIDTPKISELAYEILHEKIVSKEFAPGERLDLKTIEAQLDISRTPLKEALNRLAAEGLVEVVARSGTYVTDPSADEIGESFDVRRALELHAVEVAIERASDEDIHRLREIIQTLDSLAAEQDRDAIYPQYLNVDHRFHSELVNLAGNQRLTEAHTRENLHAQMARIRYRSSERELHVAQAEHERIIDALEARNADAVMAELDAHLRRAKRSLLTDMMTAVEERTAR
jgi:DNA-binding GntR family transcriptional regulator